MADVTVWQFTNGELRPKVIDWLEDHDLDDLLETMGYMKAGNLL